MLTLLVHYYMRLYLLQWMTNDTEEGFQLEEELKKESAKAEEDEHELVNKRWARSL